MGVGRRFQLRTAGRDIVLVPEDWVTTHNLEESVGIAAEYHYESCRAFDNPATTSALYPSSCTLSGEEASPEFPQHYCLCICLGITCVGTEGHGEWLWLPRLGCVMRCGLRPKCEGTVASQSSTIFCRVLSPRTAMSCLSLGPISGTPMWTK